MEISSVILGRVGKEDLVCVATTEYSFLYLICRLSLESKTAITREDFYCEVIVLTVGL